MDYQRPDLPTPAELQSLGVRRDRELHGGHQSVVFAATVDGSPAAVKLTDRQLSARPETAARTLATRMGVAERLSSVTPTVARPVPLDGALVQTVGPWLMSATRLVDGPPLDPADPNAAHSLGTMLAELHGCLLSLPTVDLPPVAPLRHATEDVPTGSGWQLLHGDFSGNNVIAGPTGPRIIDLDDCGYGPPAYDVANSLYMVLFDASVNGAGPDDPFYRGFRSAFLDGYRTWHRNLRGFTENFRRR